MGAFDKFKGEKPWAIMGITRRQWQARKPWKAARMTEKAFAELVRQVPAEDFKNLREEADAEELMMHVFGKAMVEGGE